MPTEMRAPEDPPHVVIGTLISTIDWAYVLSFRLSDVLDEQLKALRRPMVFPACRMSERGQRTGCFVDGQFHLLFFALATMH